MFPRSGITTILSQTMSGVDGIRNSKLTEDDKPEMLISQLINKILNVMTISQVKYLSASMGKFVVQYVSNPKRSWFA